MAALWLFAGILIGACLPDRIRTTLSGWVRGAWAWAWGRVRKRVSTPQSATAELIAAANATVRPAPKMSLVKGAANIAGFFAGVLGWILRNPIPALGVALILLFLVFGSPFEFGKSRGQLRLEREIAEASARIAEHEARLGEVSRDLAVNTERDRRRRSEVIAKAEQEIEDAVAQVDFDRLHNAYSLAHRELWNDFERSNQPDPDARGSRPVRRADGTDA